MVCGFKWLACNDDVLLGAKPAAARQESHQRRHAVEIRPKHVFSTASVREGFPRLLSWSVWKLMSREWDPIQLYTRFCPLYMRQMLPSTMHRPLLYIIRRIPGLDPSSSRCCL